MLKVWSEVCAGSGREGLDHLGGHVADGAQQARLGVDVLLGSELSSSTTMPAYCPAMRSAAAMARVASLAF